MLQRFSSVNIFTLVFLFLAFAFCAPLTGCALLGGGDEENVGTKNKEIKYKAPPTPYTQVLISSADYVWQSKKTGSTIAINSLCNRYQDGTLSNLKKNILSGIDGLSIEKTEKIIHSGKEAEKIMVKGTTEGVPINVSLLILQKNGCTFDIAYISRASSFNSELAHFEKFLKDVVIP